MKKIISALLTVVIFAVPVISFAAVHNNDQYSPATLSIVNKTTTQAGTTTATGTMAVVARGTSTPSPATVVINGSAEVIVSGERRAYHIVWKNTSGGALKNVVVRTMLPSTVNFEGVTLGAYSKADNAVAIDIKDLAVGASGETFIFATANNSLVDGQLVVITASMVYTTMANVQGDVIAYTTHKGAHSSAFVIEAVTNSLGASLSGSGSFLPTTFFGWMLLVILVLILVLLGNHLYGRFSGEAKH